MNLSSMRTLVRRDLKDEDNSSYRWQDDEIDRAIQRAVAELSRCAPREMKTTIATTDSSREISISSLTERVSVDRLEFPAGNTPRSFQRFLTPSCSCNAIAAAFQGSSLKLVARATRARSKSRRLRW